VGVACSPPNELMIISDNTCHLFASGVHYFFLFFFFLFFLFNFFSL
jgi:hypothetical protein